MATKDQVREVESLMERYQGITYLKLWGFLQLSEPAIAGFFHVLRATDDIVISLSQAYPPYLATIRFYFYH
ncbi:hypothetical protein GCM10011328_42640 [Hafnia psychrotolerans]|uniref:Uncharacterized protein n=1 Tax=Hafnia psychrotolerans TaxID=1477018 RepID=A0ABQ1H9N8_9GAMM|nr:hypothetical protein GCM10011328_42640 [Hafnia psychrotolerans]